MGEHNLPLTEDGLRRIQASCASSSKSSCLSLNGSLSSFKLLVFVKVQEAWSVFIQVSLSSKLSNQFHTDASSVGIPRPHHTWGSRSCTQRFPGPFHASPLSLFNSPQQNLLFASHAVSQLSPYLRPQVPSVPNKVQSHISCQRLVLFLSALRTFCPS